MDKLFLAVVAIGLIVLIAAGMLFATAPKRTTSSGALPISQPRHRGDSARSARYIRRAAPLRPHHREWVVGQGGVYIAAYGGIGDFTINHKSSFEVFLECGRL